MDRKDKIKRLKLLREKQKRLCEKSYYSFFEKAWEILEPRTPFVPNWHIEYLCDVLQKEVHRIGHRQPKTKDLIINIPPRSGKSHICTVMLNAWAWIHYPWLRFINSSYEKTLSLMLSSYTRTVIESEWYQKNWGHLFKLKDDQNAKSHFENDKGGRRIATSVGGSSTGKGADFVICDDLMNPKKADSKAHVKSVHEHFNRVLYSRLDDQSLGLRIIVEQRLRQNDLTGHLISKDKEAYKHICLPAIKADNISPTELSEKYVDDLFFPERFGREILERLKKGLRSDSDDSPALTTAEFVGQYLQKPGADSGNIFYRKDFRFWTHSTLPQRFDIMIQSWDLTFRKTDNGSYVVGQVWGKKGANSYLIFQIRKRMDYAETLKTFFKVTDDYPDTRKKLIEGKANGDAIASIAQKEIPGIELVPVTVDKPGRANAVTYVYDSGNVYIPHPSIHPWVNDYVEEHVMFPNGINDDQVDSSTQALDWLYTKNRSSKMREFLEKL